MQVNIWAMGILFWVEYHLFGTHLGKAKKFEKKYEQVQ